MDSLGKDPVVARALALTLMRQALALLDAAGETEPAVHLQMAMDHDEAGCACCPLMIGVDRPEKTSVGLEPGSQVKGAPASAARPPSSAGADGG